MKLESVVLWKTCTIFGLHSLWHLLKPSLKSQWQTAAVRTSDAEHSAMPNGTVAHTVIMTMFSFCFTLKKYRHLLEYFSISWVSFSYKSPSDIYMEVRTVGTLITWVETHLEVTSGKGEQTFESFLPTFILYNIVNALKLCKCHFV